MNNRQAGSLLIPLVISIALGASSLIFAVWAFSGRQDYKNKSDQKSALAVQAAVKAEDTKKTAEFAESIKSPLKTYTGPEALGTIKLQYPKTWSSYVVEGTGLPLDGYFQPDTVPSVTGNTLFALRLQVSAKSYDQELQGYSSIVKSGKVQAAPYRTVLQPGVLGTSLTGQMTAKGESTMVLLPLRDKSLKLWTEGNSFINDFKTLILPNLNFIP